MRNGLKLNLKTLWFLQFTLVVGLFVALQFIKPLRFNTDISQLFPAKSANPDVQAIFEQYAELNQNHNLILVADQQFEKAKAKASALAKELALLEGVESAQAEFPSQLSIESVLETLAPYRHLLLSDEYRQALDSNSGDALYQLIFSELNQMANPAIASSIELDPTLSLANYLTTRPINSKLKQDGPYFYAQQDGRYYVMVHFKTLSSGLSLQDNVALVREFEQVERQLNAELVKLGAVFFAEYAGTNAKHEMTLFSALAIAGMSLLVILAYRSVLALAMTLVVTSLSLFYGYVCLNLLFDQVHILTFVFSVTLVGVSCDYCFHALTHLRANAGQGSPSLKPIRLPLLMGFISTATGYLILVFSPVQVFLQIALFTVAGLAISVFTVLALFPALPLKPQASSALARNPLYRLQQGYCSVRSVWVLVAFFVGGLAWFSQNLVLNDDVRKFYEVSATLKADELKAKSLLGDQAENQFVIVKGSTPDAVLAQERQLLVTLGELKQAQAIQGYSALSQWLAPVSEQQANVQALERAIQQEWLTPLAELLGHSNWQLNTDGEPLTVEAWLASPLGKQHQNQWLQKGESYYAIVKLIGIQDLNRLTEQVAQVDGVLLVDRASEVSEQLSLFRNQLLLFLAGSFFILLVILSRVYDVKRSCAVLAVTLASVSVALMVSLALKQELNIFNVMSVVIIIALGLDYAIFYADQGLTGKVSYTTLISALSSIFVFAVLVLSQTPAIHNFGLTVFIGILAAYLLAPLVSLARKGSYP